MTYEFQMKASSLLSQLRCTHIETERDTEFRKQLDRLLARDESGALVPEAIRFTGNRETRGVMLVEGSGGGKTTALSKVLSEHPALQETDLNYKRYLSVQVPSPATQKSVGLAILAATGVFGISERRSAGEIWNMIKHRLGVLGTVLLWLDEAQDLIYSDTPNEIDKMLKNVKSLMQGDNAVIVVLSGTERLFDLTAVDAQVNRRFTKILPRPLIPGTDDEATVTELISHYCEEAGLKFNSHTDLAGRVIYGGRGKFGRSLETVLNSVENALLEGAEALTLDHFAAAWTAQEGCAWDQNIFAVPDFTSIILDEKANRFEADRAARLTRRRERG